MSLARSRKAVEMIRLTRLTTVGSLAITSMSWRFLASPLAVLRVEVFDHLLDRHLVALGDFCGDFGGGRCESPPLPSPLNSRMSSITRWLPGAAVAM